MQQTDQLANNYNEQLRNQQKLQARNQNAANANLRANLAQKRVANNLAQKGLQSVGVPKALSNKIVNSKLGQKAMQKGMETAKKRVPALNLMSKLFDKKDNKPNDTTGDNSDEKQEGILAGATVNIKLIIKLAAIFTPVLVVVVFCCLFITSSNVYLKAVGLSHADSTSDSDAEKKINDQIEKHPDDMEVKDASLDFFIDEELLKFRNNKLEKMNFKPVSFFKRKPRNTETSLDDLRDFYPGMSNYLTGEYDQNLVYYFFLKMYKLNQVYESYPRDSKNTKPLIDLPLLMATLMIQSDDMNDIINSNLTESEKKGIMDPDNYGYDHDWSSYEFNKDNGPHDMEILAQHMVSRQAKEVCKDSSGKISKTNILKGKEINTQVLTCANGQSYSKGGEYYAFDNEKYEEFLKEYIEKKYYLNSGSPSYDDDPATTKSYSNFVVAMLKLANNEYAHSNENIGGEKYIRAYGEGFGPGTPWCAIFVWWLSANTTVNGKSIYPDIIKHKTAGTGSYIRYFNSSTDSNIKFYYNDSCSNLKNKNGSGVHYTPKPGDYIFFDWQKQFYDISSNTQDHVGIVEKYEDGTIYTIEGNSRNLVKKKKYPIDSCWVIGFGSWY